MLQRGKVRVVLASHAPVSFVSEKGVYDVTPDILLPPATGTGWTRVLAPLPEKLTLVGIKGVGRGQRLQPGGYPDTQVSSSTIPEALLSGDAQAAIILAPPAYANALARRYEAEAALCVVTVRGYEVGIASIQDAYLSVPAQTTLTFPGGELWDAEDIAERLRSWLLEDAGREMEAVDIADPFTQVGGAAGSIAGTLPEPEIPADATWERSLDGALNAREHDARCVNHRVISREGEEGFVFWAVPDCNIPEEKLPDHVEPAS